MHEHLTHRVVTLSICLIPANFSRQSKIIKQGTTECVKRVITTRSSDEDENIIIKDLRKLRPFRIVAERSHASFKNMEVSPLVGLDMLRFF